MRNDLQTLEIRGLW